MTLGFQLVVVVVVLPFLRFLSLGFVVVLALRAWFLWGWRW